MPAALAISPHLDDAAFSCGGTLAALGASGWRVVMLTVFTASVPDPRGFALACQLDKGLSPDIDYMSLRRDEDRVAAARLGIDPPLWLPHREAPHRGYGSAAELFAGLREDDAVHGAVAEGIVRAATEVQPDLILAPQGIGGHVDHVQVVHAIRIAALRAPVLWWRDFPYVVRDDEPREPFRAAMEALPEGAVALSEDARARKRAACLAYHSQIGFQFGGEAGLDRRLDATGGVELFRIEGEVPWDGLELRA
jgi:LmbE family N-acetylglucosaminyl deacetylase